MKFQFWGVFCIICISIFTMQGPKTWDTNFSNEFEKLALKRGKFYVKPIFTIFLGKILRKISKSAWIARWSRERCMDMIFTSNQKKVHWLTTFKMKIEFRLFHTSWSMNDEIFLVSFYYHKKSFCKVPWKGL